MWLLTAWVGCAWCLYAYASLRVLFSGLLERIRALSHHQQAPSGKRGCVASCVCQRGAACCIGCSTGFAPNTPNHLGTWRPCYALHRVQWACVVAAGVVEIKGRQRPLYHDSSALLSLALRSVCHDCAPSLTCTHARTHTRWPCSGSIRPYRAVRSCDGKVAAS